SAEHPPDGFRVDLALGLRRTDTGQFCGAVDLLQIDPDRAEKANDFRAERSAAGIDKPSPPEPELVAQRTVNQHLANGAQEAQTERQRLALRRGKLGALGDAAEEIENAALERRG